jgi:hypothetical protein
MMLLMLVLKLQLMLKSTLKLKLAYSLLIDAVDVQVLK